MYNRIPDYLHSEFCFSTRFVSFYIFNAFSWRSCKFRTIRPIGFSVSCCSNRFLIALSTKISEDENLIRRIEEYLTENTGGNPKSFDFSESASFGTLTDSYII